MYDPQQYFTNTTSWSWKMEAWRDALWLMMIRKIRHSYGRPGFVLQTQSTCFTSEISSLAEEVDELWSSSSKSAEWRGFSVASSSEVSLELFISLSSQVSVHCKKCPRRIYFVSYSAFRIYLGSRTRGEISPVFFPGFPCFKNFLKISDDILNKTDLI